MVLPAFLSTCPALADKTAEASQAAATPQLAAIAQAVRDAKAAAKPPDSRLFQPGMAEKHGQQ